MSRRAGGRAARQAARLHAVVAGSVPFLTRTLRPVEVLSDEGLSLLEENADTILEQVGIEFRDAPDARAPAGCIARIEEERVRFPRGLARELVQGTAPSGSPSSHATPTQRRLRWLEHDLRAYGSPFVRDLDGRRRYGTIEDFRNFVRLANASPWLHHSGGTVCEPVDVPVNKRHYDMVAAHMRSATSRSWARSRILNAHGTRSTWLGSSSAPRSSSRTRSCSA